MNHATRYILTMAAAMFLAGPAFAQQGQSTSNRDAEPSAKEVMASPQVQQAMSAAMEVLRQMDAAQGGSASKSAAGNDAASSDAMRDAAGVARGAFEFAAKNPNATEADKQATANSMMHGIFRRELMGTSAADPQQQEQEPQATTKAKDYGDVDDN